MSDDRFRLDDDTIERGYAHLDELRLRLRAPSPPPSRSGRSRSIPDPQPTDDDWSVERMTAGMAAAGERDQLVARVAALESEVGKLRAALAAVLSAVADGLRPDDG